MFKLYAAQIRLVSSLRGVSFQPILNGNAIGFHPSNIRLCLLYRLLHRPRCTSELAYVLVGEFQ